MKNNELHYEYGTSNVLFFIFLMQRNYHNSVRENNVFILWYYSLFSVSSEKQNNQSTFIPPILHNLKHRFVTEVSMSFISIST